MLISKELMDSTEIAVVEAGRLMLDNLIKDEDIIQKSGEMNFVTKIDLMVEAYLTKRLNEIIPNSNVIAEEADQNNYNFDKPTWILDPVDGTTNLMYNFQLSAVSLALYIDGKASLGYVYNPFTKEMFFAQKGKGAFLNGKPIKVSSTEKLSDSLVIFGSNPYNREKARHMFDRLYKVFMSCREIRNIGSAALDLCYVACGRAEAFFEERLMPWDMAAGLLILNEAGGSCINWQNNEPNVLEPQGIISTNGKISKELYELIDSME